MSDHNKCPSSEKEHEKCIFRLSYFHRIQPIYISMFPTYDLTEAVAEGGLVLTGGPALYQLGREEDVGGGSGGVGSRWLILM